MDGCLELYIYFIFAFYSNNALQKKNNPEANKTKMFLHNLQDDEVTAALM